MNMSNEEKTMFDALTWCGVKALPSQDDGSKVWVYAISKVCKSDGSISYCVLKHDYTGEIRVIKDFGNAASIMKYVAIYPYDYLKKKYIPKFGAKTDIEDKVYFVNSVLGSGTVNASMSEEQIEEAIIKTALYKQIKNIPV